MKHPIQPIYRDEAGSLRFKQNAIVQHLLDSGDTGMNELACMPFPQEDREQFAQLIGYSLSGASELSYFSSQALEAAELIYSTGADERDARIEYLETELKSLKDGLRGPIANLYGIHPDDLE